MGRSTTTAGFGSNREFAAEIFEGSGECMQGMKRFVEFFACGRQKPSGPIYSRLITQSYAPSYEIKSSPLFISPVGK